MKTISFLSLALLQLTISPGLALYTGTGFGDHLSGTNASLFRNSTQTTPNIASVPFKVGDVDFRLEIRSSTLDGMGNTTSAVFTQYSLLWDDQADLNDTVRQAEGLGDDERPRLCATLPLSFFDAQATNAYDEDEPGSCAGPLGKKCFDSLTSAGFGGAVDDCTTPILPDECTNKLPGGGLGTASILSNETQFSFARFAYYNEVVQSYTASEADAQQAAQERLYMVIFADQNSYHPVCIRPQATKVSKGDPSVSGAERYGWSQSTILVLLVGAFFFTF